MTDLFVVLATCAREALLERTLASLAQCSLPAAYRGAIVVENGRKGQVEQVVASAPASLRIAYLFQPVGNKSLALNAALERVGRALVVFLDDDIRLDPESLNLFCAAGETYGPGHFFGGPIESDYEVPPADWLKNYLPKSATRWSLGTPEQVAPFPVDDPMIRFMGCNWAAFAEDIRNLGGFDQRYGPGSTTGSVGQESQMQVRLLQAGARAVYVPRATAYHWVPADRCSETFALLRAHREGILWGLQKQHVGGPAVAGYPVSFVRRTLRSWVRAQLLRVAADPQARFAARYKFQRLSGELRGLVMRARTSDDTRQPVRPWT